MLTMLNDLLWDKLLIALLIGAGLYFSIASRGVQLRYFGRMWRVLRHGFAHQKGHLSPFQALVVSVAGRVGGGNIAGVAVAITLGGPGAIFWMWLIGLMGMATSFFECALAQLFKREQADGSYRGGPAYYLSYGLGMRRMAVLYSLLLLLTFGFGFNALQSFVVASAMDSAFGLPVWVSGVVLAVAVGGAIFGGISRIAVVSEIIVPVMAVGYLLLALVIIALNIAEVPGILAMIVRSAFGLEQAVGGGIAAALMQGVRRGLFSNEAGLGSAPNVAATAEVTHPADQGMVQSLSVFIDTLLMCTCTAVIILLSSQYAPGMLAGDGVVLTQLALGEHLGAWGGRFVSIALLLFAFSSILYNYYLGENSLAYLSNDNPKLRNGFRVCVMGLVLWGAMQNLGTVFGFADLTMGLLALVNLLALIGLRRVALRLLSDYERAPDQPFNAAAFADQSLDQKVWPPRSTDAVASDRT